MKRLLLPCLLIVIGLIPLHGKAQNHSQELNVIIIRHAEKPLEGDNLSCRGFNRATRLPKVIVGKFGVPAQIYVPAPDLGKTTKGNRMLQTAMPLAIKYNLSINSKFATDDIDGLVKSISKQTGTVLIIWEHKAIPEIAHQFGIKSKLLDWPGDDFDSIWLIHLTANGKPTLTFQKEGIVPADACNF